MSRLAIHQPDPDPKAPLPSLLSSLERHHHGLTLQEWADVAEAICPAEYAEPPSPTRRSNVLTCEARHRGDAQPRHARPLALPPRRRMAQATRTSASAWPCCLGP